SGLGKQSGRGGKGQKHTKSGNVRVGFEGGQMPMQRRLPKRGFSNPFRVEWPVVNLAELARHFAAGSTVDLSALKDKGLLRRRAAGVKVLGQGDLGHALTVKANKFSRSAKEKIEQAGGTAEVVG
ncbi:MAG: 50S ribosomal protein L15, partial [Deltaproteobacteria bacterium]|nr:50S ribosomal protein L15 [Deltaproteobacteria bacterium]